MAAPSYTYTLTNGTTADASQVMQDFNDILNGVTDGTKDLSISALTVAGTLTANGHVNVGNSSSDDLSITASLATSIPIKTTNAVNIGSSTLGLASAYFGANSQTVRLLPSASMSATWTLTLPVTAGTSGYFLKTNGSGVSSWGQLDSTGMITTGAEVTQSAPGVVKSAGQLLGTNTNDAAGVGYVGQQLPATRLRSNKTALTSPTTINVTTSNIQLSAGDWEISGIVAFELAGATVTVIGLGISTSTGALSGADTIAVPTGAELRMGSDGALFTLATGTQEYIVPTFQCQVTGTPTIFLVAGATFSVGTVNVYGSIRATRVR